MAKVRMVNTRIWSDSWVLDLDPSEKLLWVYLITNAHTDLCGIYEIHTRVIAMETWFDKDMVEKILTRFTKDGKVKRYKSRIRIENFSKHQTTNPSIQKWIERSIKLVPKDVLDNLNTASIQPVDSLSHLDLDSNLDLNLDSIISTNVDTDVKESEEDLLWDIWKEYWDKDVNDLIAYVAKEFSKLWLPYQSDKYERRLAKSMLSKNSTFMKETTNVGNSLEHRIHILVNIYSVGKNISKMPSITKLSDIYYSRAKIFSYSNLYKIDKPQFNDFEKLQREQEVPKTFSIYETPKWQ